MDLFLNVFLFVTLVILLIPKPFKWTIKRLSLMLLVVAGILIIGVVFVRPEKVTVRITALNQKSESSEATEIWVKEVIVDDKEYKPSELFDGSWKEDKGWLKWRSYDEGAGENCTLTGKIPRGNTVQLCFDACKWRGLVSVESDFGNAVIDTYAPTDKPETEIKVFEFSTKADSLTISGKNLLQIIIVGLTVLAICSVAVRILKRKKQGLPFVVTSQDDYSNREIWLDVLKVISAFFIVQIHVVGGDYQNSFGSEGWWIIHFLNVIPRFAVPVFMMVSGVLLLGRETTIEKAVKKAGKAIALLFIWNMVYLLVSRILWDSDNDIWHEILAIPVKRQFSGHLWYIYFLVWMYLFCPILNVFYRMLTVKQRWYFVLLTIVVPGVLDLYNSWFSYGGQSPIQSWQLYMVPSYAGLMLLGRLLYDEADRIRHVGLCGLFFSLIGFSGGFFLTAAYCKNHGSSTDLFISENRLFMVFFAVGVFLLVFAFAQKLNDMPLVGKKIFTFISKRSIGIYLFHVIPIWTFSRIPFFDELLSSYYGATYTLMKCFVYFIISIYCVAAMSEIPVLRKTVM